jgi:hypothetical protein
MLQQVFNVVNFTIEMMQTPINKLKQIRVYFEIRGLQITLYYALYMHNVDPSGTDYD